MDIPLQNRKLLAWLFVGTFLWVHPVHGQGTTDTAWTSAAVTGNGDAKTKTNDASFFGLARGSSSSIPPNLRPFQLVLPRAHLLGDWDGLRPKLEEHGFTPSSTLVTGLGICGSVLVSPDESVSQMPYFVTAGIIARGFFPSRPTDMAGFGIALGNFSRDLRQAQEREQLLDPTIGAQDYESVLELTYRAYFCKSAIFFQPDVQYVINPRGTGRIDDALVLGFQIGFNF